MRDFVSPLGESVRARRRMLGQTQSQLAEAAGVSVELISRIERGRCAPSLRTLLALCASLEATPNDLLGFEAKANESGKRMAAVFSVLPRARQRELTRIAEALVRYGQDD